MTDYTPDPEVVRVAATALAKKRLDAMIASGVKINVSTYDAVEVLRTSEVNNATAALRALHEAGYAIVPREPTVEAVAARFAEPTT